MSMQELFLFFDTETTGIPLDWRAPATDLDNWPRVVQLAWELYDESATQLSSAVSLIKPDGFTIPADASRVHGITTERALADGRDISDVLQEFLLCVPGATLVAHNIAFDEPVLEAEYFRLGMQTPFAEQRKLCTMLSSTKFCRIRNTRGGLKWPRLEELHTHLFGSAFDGAHDATNDVTACARCFFELRRLAVI